MKPNLGIRTSLLVVTSIAIAFAALHRVRSHEAARLKLASALRDRGVIAVEQSQLDGVQTIRIVKPFQFEFTLPKFKRKNYSSIRGLIGDELFVDFRAVVIFDMKADLIDVTDAISCLGNIEAIYILPNAGFNESQVASIRKSFPSSQVIQLNATPVAPEIGLDLRDNRMHRGRRIKVASEVISSTATR